MFHVRTDQIEYPRQRRDEQVLDVVFGVDTEGSALISYAILIEETESTHRLASISSGIRARSIRRRPSVFETM